MGKRDRRRKRERAKAKGSAAGKLMPARPEPARLLYPDAGTPLVEIHIAEDADDETRALCVGYWEFLQPGSWSRPVASLGSTSVVYKAVQRAAYASLLTVLCPECTAPTTVNSRSEMAATGHWTPDMPTAPVSARSVCSDCSAAATAARQQEAAAAKEHEEARKARRVANAIEWLEQEQEVASASGPPSTPAALAVLAITEIMAKAGTKAIGPFDKLDYTLTGTADGDTEALLELHRGHWLVPTPPTTLDAVAFNDDDSVRAVYIKSIPWTLPRWMGSAEGRNKYAKTAMEVHLERNPKDIEKVLIDVKANMVVDYLNGLLERKYREDSIPEHRLPDAYETVKNALAAGFTLEQLVAVAWSAAAGSVAWGQRTPGLKPGSVAAATVTNLARRIGYAGDRPTPDYELPNWVPRPAMYAAALRMQARCDVTAEAMRKFFSLQQRVNSRQADEMEADFASHRAMEQRDSGQSVSRLGADLPPEAESPIWYAVLSANGTLTFAYDVPSEMRNSVTRAGSGLVDRIMIEGTPTINAYVGELIPATMENRNRTGAEMMYLLGEPQDVVLGPIAFFAVTRHQKSPHGLDSEQQELLQAAHDAVRASLAN